MSKRLLYAVCASLPLWFASGTSVAGLPAVANPPDSVSQTDARTPPGNAPLFESAPMGAKVPAQARENGNADNLRQHRLLPLRQAAKRCLADGMAAGATSAEQTWILALLTLHGQVGLPDRPAADGLFRTAWNCGHALAAAGLSWCALEGCSARPSHAQAMRWADTLLRTHPGRALYLRWWMESLSPRGVSGQAAAIGRNGEAAGRDRINAALLKQAADLGDVQALNELGMQSAAAGQLEQSFDLFTRAAGKSRAARDNALIVRQRLAIRATLQRWSSVPLPGEPWVGQGQDRIESGLSDSGESLFQMARRFHRGDGVAVNYPEAIRWYRAARAAGSLKAARMLEQIYARTDPALGLNAEWMAQLANLPFLSAGAGSMIEPLNANGMMGTLRRDETALSDFIPDAWIP